jgi:hypothetical protein
MQRKPRKNKQKPLKKPKKEEDNSLAFVHEDKYGEKPSGKPWHEAYKDYQTIARKALCYLCNHLWIAMVPADYKKEHVKCPNCGEFTGFFAEEYDDGADDNGTCI